MKEFFKHLFEQPFIATTGIAALVHSTWALGTLFSGAQPDPTVGGIDTKIEYVFWLAPAFLIAFSLDVGQIMTSAEIRAGQRTRAKYVTFAIFAAATYYLQWLYISHHMPALELAAGVRQTWQEAATFIRDAAIWFIPALLPLSTLLYTFSQGHAGDINPGHSTESETRMPTGVALPVTNVGVALDQIPAIQAGAPAGLISSGNPSTERATAEIQQPDATNPGRGSQPGTQGMIVNIAPHINVSGDSGPEITKRDRVVQWFDDERNMHLFQHGLVPQAEVARVCGVSSATVSRVIRELDIRVIQGASLVSVQQSLQSQQSLRPQLPTNTSVTQVLDRIPEQPEQTDLVSVDEINEEQA